VGDYEYDITQLHENTHYRVCVKVFTTQPPVNDNYDDLDRRHPGIVDVWNNYGGSESPLSDGMFYRQYAAFKIIILMKILTKNLLEISKYETFHFFPHCLRTHW